MEGIEVTVPESPRCIHTNSLLDLPNELLDHVFAVLDTEPCSEGMFNDLPALTWPASTHRTLKNISLLSHRIRSIVQSRLFAYARIDSDSVGDFLYFTRRAGLSSTVQSVVFRVLRAHTDPGGSWWCQLLNEVPASRIVVQCKPELYQSIAKIDVKLSDSWAFNIPCQYVELRQSQDSILPTADCDPKTGLFAAKSWQSMRVNEGSSLAAYTTYEYFLKKPPSLMANVQHYLNVLPRLAEPAAYHQTFGVSAIPVMATLGMVSRLQEFSYVAIFPFYNHVDEILKCVLRMENLRRFSVKLCPEPDSTVLEDEIRAAKGHIDLNDPWSEYVSKFPIDKHGDNCPTAILELRTDLGYRASISYDLIAYVVHTMGISGRLETFTAGDLNVTGFRDKVQSDISARLQNSWIFDETDTWTKQIDDESNGAVLITP